MDLRRLAAGLAIEIPLVTVPLVVPAIPLWLGIVCWILAAALGLYAAETWLRQHVWWRFRARPPLSADLSIGDTRQVAHADEIDRIYETERAKLDAPEKARRDQAVKSMTGRIGEGVGKAFSDIEEEADAKRQGRLARIRRGEDE